MKIPVLKASVSVDRVQVECPDSEISGHFLLSCPPSPPSLSILLPRSVHPAPLTPGGAFRQEGWPPSPPSPGRAPFWPARAGSFGGVGSACGEGAGHARPCILPLGRACAGTTLRLLCSDPLRPGPLSVSTLLFTLQSNLGAHVFPGNPPFSSRMVIISTIVNYEPWLIQWTQGPWDPVSAHPLGHTDPPQEGGAIATRMVCVLPTPPPAGG